MQIEQRSARMPSGQRTHLCEASCARSVVCRGSQRAETPVMIRPGSCYDDSEKAVYDDEMEKIFGRAWLMIGHESLVAAPDDFFHTYMGEDPVILTRDGEGRLHALLNMCRHRGNRVVRCDDGNAKRFMCTYHGWTYRNDGALEYVPGEAQAYYDALDKPSLGLIEARVETYAGIV